MIAGLRRIHEMLQQTRARWGAKWCVVVLLMPPALFGIWYGGVRAAFVVGLAVLLCMLAGIVPRVVAREPFEWFHPGAIITGLLLGLTLSVDTPIYMIIVGALVAEIAGKYHFPGLGRNLFNPAALGRTAVALLEFVDPSAYGAPSADVVSGASALFKEAGGNIRPAMLDLFMGWHPGAIGETSEFVLIPMFILMLGYVVLKRHAALAMIAAVPLAALAFPAPPEIIGHAPWALDPLVYLFASNTLLLATFFLTDPVTTPNSRMGAILFGAGAGAIGVAARRYTSIPGPEMYIVLLMNALTPWLDRLFLRESSTVTTVASEPLPGPDDADHDPDMPSAGQIPRITSTARLGAFAVYQEIVARGNRQEVVEEIRASQLSGCGGARFPVHRKWEGLLAQPGHRILIANGQEGEPETFKDRYLMQHHPQLVMEGIAIAAWTLEVDEVIIVTSAHSPASQRAMQHALEAFLQHPASRSVPPPSVVVGSPYYICGEETALIEFLETGRGEPRLRPPLPIERGLRGNPTLVQNVETLSWLPSILHHGAGWFRGDSGGYQLVSLSGAVRQPGVYEVATGTPLSDILKSCGGLPMDQEPTAVAVGGPSGGFLPLDRISVPFAPRPLRDAGTMMGTGAIRVLGDNDNLVEEALAAAEFFRSESCGRCTPCRVGTSELVRLWRRIADGEGTTEDLAQLHEVAHVLKSTSTCGLGVVAASRILSVLEHWPDQVAVVSPEAVL